MKLFSILLKAELIAIGGVITTNYIAFTGLLASENTIAVRLREALLCPGALAPGFKGGSARNVWHP
ncbi:MAG: hypothetical protein COW65_13795 [Cytophagales bacterium CG18_big_fil_WC_8_21_14_2_50_42_9]|nr:MAG: hypothetical protein COW65_13795 [Cytophagales bacterium CG18_big_fil_WC_8_21_14_2_50_42_9]